LCLSRWTGEWFQSLRLRKQGRLRHQGDLIGELIDHHVPSHTDGGLHLTQAQLAEEHGGRLIADIKETTDEITKSGNVFDGASG